ncbi:MAG TPA: rhomboid family intramembrane serine protease [Verrucomicrobiae bacterium]
MSLPLLRRRADPAALATLWQATQRTGRVLDVECPSCFQRMKEVQFAPKGEVVPIDVCQRCQFLWFDSGELARVPKYTPPPKLEDRLPQKAREALALIEVEKIREEAEAEAAREGPEHVWQLVVGVLGFPVEHNAEPFRRHPVATWVICALIFVVSTMVFTAGRDLLLQFAFIPNEPFRYLGMTWLTSFFVHGGWIHLSGNLYFLYVFGDNVEDTIGWKAFVLVLLAGTIFGHALHWMVEPRADVPTVGASGGISAVIALYALAFPHTRLGIFSRYGWINFSARMGFFVWVGMQFLGAYAQVAGVSNVSSLAHLGGCLPGVFYWVWRTRSGAGLEVARAG